MTAELEQLARTALGAYELGDRATLRTLEIGLNAVFEVRAGSARYVLRVHRAGYRTPAHVWSELTFLRAVGDDPEVPVPIETRNGGLFVEVADADGQRHSCDLQTWLDGRVLVPGHGLGVAGVHSLGQGLGRIHNAAEGFSPPPGFELPVWDADGMFTTEASPFRPTLGIDDVLGPEDRDLYDEVADRTRAVFEKLGRGADAFGITHQDYILGNCFLRRGHGGWQVASFDFADCGWGFFLYDLCPLLGNLAGYPGAIFGNPAYPKLRDAFLAGYRTVRPLAVEWEQHVPLLIAARQTEHCLLTARPDVSPTPAQDAAWRVSLARLSLELPV
ncbi:phosphotransferase enzyme family protein [Tenggerimyces flavus]|uniref:Phosphotransferase enzyme family protein n=1 Tax=Tenggerimyces flavus TaxID=1708749 RepID=A0ABV7Y2K7_9ACTN|nr:phosphotransferase [Tenggerimyces flavus]MBM7790667.1 Ser/Thr protein kinase RdoA (MazF antagonist) [Tenggerimyces flavus]